jgi:hypothetical protein
VTTTISPPRGRSRGLLFALLLALCTGGLVSIGGQPAQATGITVYAPWDSGKQFAVGSPGGQVGGGYYGHCCPGYPSEYYSVDINGPGGGNTDCGENVRATSSGTVSAVGYYGSISYIRIDHGGGYTSEYQHVTDRLAVNTPVSRGDVIAKFGNVGTTYCHLHFVVKNGTSSIAPSPMSGVNLPSSGGTWVTSNNNAGSTPQPPPPGVNLSGAVYDGRDTLSVGQTLQANHYLTSADGRYVLFMQNDGNLVQYGPGLAALWWTGTNNGAYVAMQPDGNLVMYQSNGATAVWATHTSGTNGAYVAVQRDGNIVMYQSDGATTVWSKGATGAPWTATTTGSDRINIGQTLPANRFATSADGRYRLFLHVDGNLILYSPGYKVNWVNGKTGTNGAYVAMQSDSNFVEYLSNGATAVWSSATGGSGGAYVAVQNDGNVVMYQSNGATAVWSTHTGGVF